LIKILAAILLMAGVATNALGFGTSTEADKSKAFKDGVRSVRAEDFAVAVEIFSAILADDPNNADAYNYLAFSQRNLGQTDAAMANYEKALTLNPKHKGALEYQGELFLKLGDRARAEENLARLVAVCGRRCVERDQLQAAIERAKDGKTPWLGPRTDRGD